MDCPCSDHFLSCFVVQDSAIPKMDLAPAADDVNAALLETWHSDEDALNFVSPHSSDLDGVVQIFCIDDGLSSYGLLSTAVAEFGVCDVCRGDGQANFSADGCIDCAC